MRILIFAVGAIWLLAFPLLKAQEVSELPPVDARSEDVIGKLVSKNRESNAVFVPQNELDGLIAPNGGGACPSSAAFMLYQVLRDQAQLDPDPAPHRSILKAFSHDRTLLNGRLTNSQVSNLIRFYANQIRGYQIDIQVVSAPNSRYAEDRNIWENGFDSLTLSSPSQVNIISYTVTDPIEGFLGRHFVLQKSFSGKYIEVIDPTSPNKDRGYIADVAGNDREQLILNYPPGVSARDFKFEVNTVFKVTLRRSQILKIPTESTTVEVLKEQIDKLADRLKPEGNFLSPVAWRHESARFGLPALDLPSEFGGANWSAAKMIEVFLHAGRHNLNLRDVIGGAHARLLLKSSQEGPKDILHQMADGKGYMAIAITEPTAGSDFTALETTCKKVAGGYLLNGEKRFNARLQQATHVIVFTQSNSGKKGYLNAFVLPIKTEGLAIIQFGAHGLIGNSYGGLKLTDVFVPDQMRIGDDGDGKKLFEDHFRYWRLMQSAAALGTAERALELMAERLKTRIVNGKPIGRFTHLQQSLGQSYTELRMAKYLAIHAAQALDQGDNRQADLLIAGLKAEGVEIAIRAVDSTARAFGGEGYSDLVDIGDRLRDLQGLRIADGTTDVMRSAVVAKAYGKEFWEMAIEE